MQRYYGEYEKNGRVLLRAYVHEINRFRFNWHDFLELIIVVEGKMEAYAAGTAYQLQEDDVLLINSNVGHATLLRQVGTKAVVVHLAPEIFGKYLEGYESLRFCCGSTEGTRWDSPFVGLRQIAAVLLEELMDSQQGQALYLDAYMLLLAGKLIRDFPVERISRSFAARSVASQAILNRIMEYTEENYQKKITLNDIAALTRYNRSYISTFFKGQAGINYYEYLQRVRLRRAIQILNKTHRSITEIALDCGFGDPKAFTELFKRYFRMTPADYRDSIRQEVSPVIDELVRVYVAREHPQVEKKLREWKEGLTRISERRENGYEAGCTGALEARWDILKRTLGEAVGVMEEMEKIPRTANAGGDPKGYE